MSWLKACFLSLAAFLLPSPAWAQSVRYQSIAISGRGLPFANQNVAVCSQPAVTTTQPCTPLATLATSTSTTSGGANPLTTDANGNFFFYAAPGRYTVQIYGPAVSGQFVMPDVLIPNDPTGGTAATFTNLSVSGQITSTLATGTAPFSIASTTQVTNLNAQLHGGLTAPASAIVGISDSQTLTNKTLTSPTSTGTDSGSETLTNKTLTSPAINTPTLDGTGAAHVASQVSAVTNFGTALGSQTIIASMPSTGNVSLIFELVQVTAGVGCSAATNSVTVNPVTWTAPGGTVENINSNANYGFNGNGVVDSGSSTFGSSAFTNNGIQAIAAKVGTSVSYVTTSALASTGCSTTPQYVVYVKAIF